MGKGRRPCCDKSKVRTGPWSPAEDLKLKNFVQMHGHPNWRALPKQAGLLRCGKSCRLRWINYLRPDVKRGNFTPEEEQTIINLHDSIGNKWSKIASHLPGRTDNEVKNFWNTHLKKRANSASPSCTSSSITSTSGDNNKEKIIMSSDSETSNEANNREGCLDDGIVIEIPSESDIDIWELLETLDPIESIKDAQNGDTKFDSEVEFSKWLNFLESDFGLASDGNHMPKDQDMNLEQDISHQSDCFLTWPCSPT